MELGGVRQLIRYCFHSWKLKLKKREQLQKEESIVLWNVCYFQYNEEKKNPFILLLNVDKDYLKESLKWNNIQAKYIH